MAFDLVDQPWIPVIRGGEHRRVSLALCLSSAASIKAIVPDVATKTPAILRQVLLPVVMDALGPLTSDDEWTSLFAQREFTDAQIEVVLGYLDRHRGRFDLFHPVQPFAQAGGLQAVQGEAKPPALLSPLEATGNNVPLFSSHIESKPTEFAPDEAAQWLLHALCWDTAGIKTGAAGDRAVRGSKTTGNPAGPLAGASVVVPEGPTLFDTLVLNIPVEPAGRRRGDLPQWRREPATPQWRARPPVGPLDLMTWQSRRIRLFAQDDVVDRVLVAAGDRMGGHELFDPHVVWHTDTDVSMPAQRPLRHDTSKPMWLDADTLLARAGSAHHAMNPLLDQIALLRKYGVIDADYPLRTTAYGVEYGAQQSIVQDIGADSLHAPVDALAADGPARAALVTVVSQAEALARAVGSDDLLGDLDPLVRRVFRGIQTDADKLPDGLRAWEVLARRAAANHSHDHAEIDAVFARREPETTGGRS